MKQVFRGYCSWIWSFAKDDIGAEVGHGVACPAHSKSWHQVASQTSNSDMLPSTIFRFCHWGNLATLLWLLKQFAQTLLFQAVETPHYRFRWQKFWIQLPVFNAFQRISNFKATNRNFLKLAWATMGGAVAKSMYHLNEKSIQNESSQRIEPKLQASEGPNHQLWLCQEVHVEKCRSLQRKVFQSELLGIIATFWDATSWKFCEW